MHKGFFGSLDGILITDPSNIRYLTGFIGVTPEEREAYVLLTHNKITLFTSRLYSETARRLTNAKRLTFVELSREHPLSGSLTAITDEDHIKKLGFEETNLTVAEFNKLRQSLPDVRLVPTREKIEQVRMIKRQDEITLIRRAAALTDACLTQLTQKIHAGISENAVAMEIAQFFRQNGADNAFSPIVAFGSHTSQPHYANTPNQEFVLEKNDIILIDMGARVDGYCADMTRMLFMGTPKKEWITAYETVLAANEKALELLANGQRNGATLDAAAREIIAKAGFPMYPHSLGHAVGLDIHEAPRLTVHAEEILAPYMAVTIEPGVYIDGTYGIRIEDLVVVTDNGIEILSKSSKKIAHRPKDKG